MIWRSLISCLLAASALYGCGQQQRGALTVAYIESEDDLFGTGLRMSPGAQNLRAATGAGLVALDAQGEVVPALADRWIITDDGRSFIFRLREGTWPDGSELSAESVREQIRAALGALRGTSLGLDLAPIDEIRVMAGRVVEIRLSGPVPHLLQLLAQPELTLARGEQGSGPMVLVRDGKVAELGVKPPADVGLPDDRDWKKFVRPVQISALAAPEAIRAFDDGGMDVVLGGRIGNLPMAETGPLSRGTVRLDAVIGLFGLVVRKETGLLGTAEGRAALAMALDRPALIERFNIGGWVPTTRVAPPGLPNDPGIAEERWPGMSVEERRTLAAARVTAWRRRSAGSEDGSPPAAAAELTISMGEGLGIEWLYRQLSGQLALVGIRLVKVTPADAPDLTLVDRVARYAGARWFLNQFNCSLQRGLCSEEADALVAQAIATSDPAERGRLLAAAESALTRSNVYIPFGSPLRWSLVRGTVDGFAPNQWAFHPLPAMASLPR